MIDREIYLVLLGAGIALVTSLFTTILQHFLSLRAEKKKMEWEREENKQMRIQADLLRGVAKVPSINLGKVRRHSRKIKDVLGGIKVRESVAEAKESGGSVKIENIK